MPDTLTDDRAAALRRDGWLKADETGFIELVGPFWRQGSAGESHRFGFLAEPRHVNYVGIVQGGMLMTFADRCLGTQAWEASGNRPAVTVSFDMHFVGGARIGSFVEIAGEVVRVTRSLVFMRGLLTAGDRLLGSCQGTWKILADRARRPGPGPGAVQPGPGAGSPDATRPDDV